MTAKPRQRAEDCRPQPRTQGLLDFNRQRKAGSRERLLAAAAAAFCGSGYHAVSIEDVASSAGVSRMTFYRHFDGKAAIAAEIFRQNTQQAMPWLISIGAGRPGNRDDILAWIERLFARDRESRQLLRVFTQASNEPGFTEAAHAFIEDLIVLLGHAIPAFALRRDDPQDRRRWIEAWLLIYEILDQSNHAALESGVATEPLMPEILADRFLRFVTSI